MRKPRRSRGLIDRPDRFFGQDRLASTTGRLVQLLDAVKALSDRARVIVDGQGAGGGGEVAQRRPRRIAQLILVFQPVSLSNNGLQADGNHAAGRMAYPSDLRRRQHSNLEGTGGAANHWDK